MLTSWHLNEKSREVCIEARSPPALHSVAGMCIQVHNCKTDLYKELTLSSHLYVKPLINIVTATSWLIDYIVREPCSTREIGNDNFFKCVWAVLPTSGTQTHLKKLSFPDWYISWLMTQFTNNWLIIPFNINLE